ncbi:MAG TPA: YqaE/Pmp3 family membrane protein [Tepidisphaeraceae bacterium]|nr:YqaE/Pmp3 family membrane protein [Tepidisphaeraceae bacterium]
MQITVSCNRPRENSSYHFVMLYLLAILLPPLAVLLVGKPFQALLNLILTLCFYVPGAIHAVLVVMDHKQKQHTEAIIRATRG